MASYLRRAIGVVSLGWLILAAAPPVAAECTKLDRWPSFADAIPTARRVVIGEVTEDRDPNSSGYLGAFGLRIDEVLRGQGQVGAVWDVRYLTSGLAGRICPDGSYLRVLRGDVIALAFDAVGPDRRTRVNVVAWLRGTPDAMQAGVGEITIAELRHLVALPATDSDVDPPAEPPWPALVAPIGSSLAFLLYASRRVTLRDTD